MISNILNYSIQKEEKSIREKRELIKGGQRTVILYEKLEGNYS